MDTKRFLLVAAVAVTVGLSASMGASADDTSSSASSGSVSTGTTSTGTENSSGSTSTGATSTGTTSTGTTSTGTTSTGSTATGSTSTGTTSTGTVSPGRKNGVKDFACVAPLVSTRETALIAAIEKEQSAIKAALQTRKTALVAAWGLTDKKSVQKAINAAHKAYLKSVKDARKVALKERIAAWKAFKDSSKSCKAAKTVSERETEREDSR